MAAISAAILNCVLITVRYPRPHEREASALRCGARRRSRRGGIRARSAFGGLIGTCAGTPLLGQFLGADIGAALGLFLAVLER
jgi:hypothetical protein